jgi:hypothetical protein
MRPAPSAFAALLALALPAASAAAAPLTYNRPVPAPDPAAQLAEMVALFDEICLKAFPDDAAAAKAVAARQGTAMSAEDVRAYLHDDPGTGWHVVGRAAPFEITIEAPPFHACGIRTTAVAPFADMAPYKRLADAFEASVHPDKVGPMHGTIGNIDTSGGGEAWHRPDGRNEALFVFISTPIAEIRAKGQDAVEVRLVHQIQGAATAR